MVSHPTPSTSLEEQTIRSDALAELLENDPLAICLLDCRSYGGPIKHAQKVCLPNVLLRRLVQGSLALTTVSPRLADTSTKVVILPNENPDDTLTPALSMALRKEGICHAIFADSVDSFLSSYPNLAQDGSSFNQQAKSKDGGVACLNLNSLRLEPSAERRRSQQQFPVQILPHLFLGNAETARNQQLLESLNIHHIINVTANLPNSHEQLPSFHYLRISVDDNSSHNLIQFFPDAISFIDSAQRSGDACLVHCLAGISRSVTVCLAYLMASRRCSLEDAYDVVLRRNAAIAPNFHFMGQLTDFEGQLGLRSPGSGGTYSSVPPRSPSCAVEAAASSGGLLTPPPTSCSASPHSSAHSAKSFD